MARIETGRKDDRFYGFCVGIASTWIFSSASDYLRPGFSIVLTFAALLLCAYEVSIFFKHVGENYGKDDEDSDCNSNCKCSR